MKQIKNRSLSILLLLIILIPGLAMPAEPPVYSTNFDPNRNPFTDYKQALAKAKKENKKILIEIGGNWCSWCRIMNTYLKTNNKIRNYLFSTFVVLKINTSKDNPNKEFLSHLPKVKAMPFFVVLNSKGKVLGNQNTSVLERGRWYSDRAFYKFIHHWRNKKG